ncbi:glycoside hydrolase family 2 TIM barrel-domain containing protein [Microbulbifer rhizosphaerae]|uniref:Beta-galactosidase n=1 Tax=Microbulbifer rhizosphaerae TaxID=1562603 RepID=A0A7W4WFI8_9GAMM|nr:glycoside hydrolase family 2 TIM barrel-domain containing protein [Microbulbifer rhizosphaerae]MBB3062738.1 beta-galactosidase [Microbulbifer rhizosphaerae]
MSKILIKNVAVVLVILLAACGKPAQEAKTKPKAETEAGQLSVGQPQKLNRRGWQFMRSDSRLSLEDALQSGNWQSVTLPHTPRIEPRIVDDQWQGDAWYRLDIPLRSEWSDKKVYIDFEGAMNLAEIWLNGKKIGSHAGGYLPFTVELTEQLKPGANRLLVRLDNRDNQVTGPKPLATLDFNMYGGLYRDVWLRAENPVHITDAVHAGEVASGGIFVRYPQVARNSAQVEVQTHVHRGAEAKSLWVEHQLLDGDEPIATSQQKLDAEGKQDLADRQTLTVTQPRLWSPSSPNLYTLRTRVYAGGELTDQQDTRIGIREFRLQNGELFINGEKTFLRGVNRHQEYPYVGYALSDAAQYRDAALIKAAGFDYVRLSHYPHSKAFMRAADELGLVLLDAILGWQYFNDTPEFRDHAVQTCRDLIRRDRNHPSVLAWECSLNESQMPEPFIDRLHAAVHEEFPGDNVYSAGWKPYGYDIYLQARQHRLDHYKEPTKPYIVSEYGDWEYYAMNAGLNQDNWGDLLQADRSSRQLLADGEKRLQQQALNLMEAHNDNFNTPAFADGYWAMFDYNRGYADDLEASGLMSIERLPKFSYYFYQSQRDANDFAGPLAGGYMVHIASHWQPGSSNSFYVFSNADEVEIRLNGKPVARSAPNSRFTNLKHPTFRFELDSFVPGTLEALAYANGKVVARHKLVTAGEPGQLQLSVETAGKTPVPGSNDLLFARVRLLDARGNQTHANGIPVTFELSGDAELVSPSTIHSEDGVASALIRLGSDLSGVNLKARSPQLSAAETALTRAE